MANATMTTFGFPGTLVRQYEHWAVLVRPAQLTLGSLVLVSTSEAIAFGALPAGAHAELAEVIPELESALKRLVEYEKINYLMLMMVDPHVHFHVLPRYSGARDWDGRSFEDQGWPGPPDLKSAVKLDEETLERLCSKISSLFD